MSTPLDVITIQAKKGNITEQEVAVLEKARLKIATSQAFGMASGVGLGFYLSRKTKSIIARLLMVTFTGAFAGGLGAAYGSYKALREISDARKYPHIAAAINDIANEIHRSRGIDPKHPERRPAVKGTYRQPDLKNLPPSMTPGEKESAAVGGFGNSDEFGLSEAALDQKEHQQMEFGNPSLQHPNENQPMEFGNPSLQRQVGQPNDRPQYRVGDAGTNSASAWDSVRTANGSQMNAWDRVRRQSSPQQPLSSRQQQQQQSANQTAQQFEDSWDKMYQDEGSLYKRDGGLSGESSESSSMLSSDDFPRSREDFERKARESNDKYSGGSAFPA